MPMGISSLFSKKTKPAGNIAQIQESARQLNISLAGIKNRMEQVIPSVKLIDTAHRQKLFADIKATPLSDEKKISLVQSNFQFITQLLELIEQLKAKSEIEINRNLLE